MNNNIIRHRGRLFVESEGKRKFLCSMSPRLAAFIELDDERAIPELDLTEAIPKLAKGLCPLCESGLKVVSTGRYRCTACEQTFINTEGYRLPVLLADEIIVGSIEGRAVQEFTTVGVAPVMPSPMKTKDGTAVGICPRCYNELNQRGECKCGWSPTDADKLWEQIVRIVERVVPIQGSKDKTVQFEYGTDLCKIVLEETDKGHKYLSRFVNITDDSIDEIIGRPKAVINFIVDKLGLQPVRQVNNTPVNSPIQETGYRLSNRDSGKDIRTGHQGSTIPKHRR